MICGPPNHRPTAQNASGQKAGTKSMDARQNPPRTMPFISH